MRFFPWNNTDPDAAAYIAAVVAAGAAITGAQSTAINAFVVAEKAASRWPSVKRLYLPIWGVAAANAIDMVARGSGTFSGGVTHGAGFIQGNGTTGGFDSGTAFNSQGLTTGSQLIFFLSNVSDTGSSYAILGGAGTSPSEFTHLTATGATQMRGYSAGEEIFLTLDRASQTGIFTVNRTSTTVATVRRRTSGGAALLATLPTAAATVIPANNFWTMRRADSAVQYNNGKFGAYGFGLGMANVDPFTANLKTLWETCTGLSLP